LKRGGRVGEREGGRVEERGWAGGGEGIELKSEGGEVGVELKSEVGQGKEGG
jgi:hypothetical protein